MGAHITARRNLAAQRLSLELSARPSASCPTSSRSCWVSLGKSLNFSEPHAHQNNRVMKCPSQQVLLALNRIIHVKDIDQRLEQTRCRPQSIRTHGEQLAWLRLRGDGLPGGAAAELTYLPFPLPGSQLAS